MGVYRTYFPSLIRCTHWDACSRRTRRPSFRQSEYRQGLSYARASTSLIYAAVIGLAIYLAAAAFRSCSSVLPQFFGTWLMLIYGTHAARRAGRERARPSAQLPDGLHEPDQPLPVLEHELPRGAPHVPAGALSRAAAAARTRESRHAQAVPSASWRRGANCFPRSSASGRIRPTT